MSLQLPRIIAHRGESLKAPENTLAACRLALENGARWLEVDVNISADGMLLLHHDDTLERCTNGTGYLVGQDSSNLRELDAGSWFSASYANEKLATLDELAELLASFDAGLNLEVKPTPGWEYPLVDAVASYIKSSWPENVPLLVSSFSPLALEALREQLPDGHLGLLVSAVPVDWLEWMKRFRCNTFHCAAAFATLELCQQAEAEGIPVLCYTVNTLERAEELFALGVTSIFTDTSATMLEALAE